MNIVLVKHAGCSQIYLFEVPSDIALKERDEVMVLTRFGETSGVCMCDSFELDGSPLNAVVKICGTRLPLKPVIGKVFVERFEAVQDEQS